ncbi:hypothetical protein [Microbispora sp. H10830]|uniref:hypothetical protein n=1 Tax=Microbispora sp. H10830 TaxID=2729109 RepID=UPI0016042990|nr:hypothetical protein [Microbispora sp. H10830]
MASGLRRGWDPLAAVTALIVLIMMGLYVGFVAQQDGQVLAWLLGALALAALLAIYSAIRTALWRGLALTVSGVILTVVGILGILSIGLPILVAGVLALVGAARSQHDRL